MNPPQEAGAVREKWKFVGREIIDGIPHLVWKPVTPGTNTDEAASTSDPAASEDEEAWGCTVDEFREVTTGTLRAA